MSSVQRPLAGEVLVHRLGQDEGMIDAALMERSGRSARTLVKEGPLRLTLMGLSRDGALAAHRAEGPVSIHVLKGSVEFLAQGQTYPLGAGDVVVFGAGVEHSATSRDGAVILLTVVQDTA